MSEDELNNLQENKNTKQYTHEEVMLLRFYDKVYSGLLIGLFLIASICICFKKKS